MASRVNQIIIVVLVSSLLAISNGDTVLSMDRDTAKRNYDTIFATQGEPVSCLEFEKLLFGMYAQYQHFEPVMKNEFQHDHKKLFPIVNMITRPKTCELHNLQAWHSDMVTYKANVNILHVIDIYSKDVFDNCRLLFAESTRKKIKQTVIDSDIWNELGKIVYELANTNNNLALSTLATENTFRSAVDKILLNFDNTSSSTNIQDNIEQILDTSQKKATEITRETFAMSKPEDCALVKLVKVFLEIWPQAELGLDEMEVDMLDRTIVYCAIKDYKMKETIEKLKGNLMVRLKDKLTGAELMEPDETHKLLKCLAKLSVGNPEQAGYMGLATYVYIPYNDPTCATDEIRRLSRNFVHQNNTNLRIYYDRFFIPYLKTCAAKFSRDIKADKMSVGKVKQIAQLVGPTIRWTLRPELYGVDVGQNLANLLIKQGFKLAHRKPEKDLVRIQSHLEEIFKDICIQIDAIKLRDVEHFDELLKNLILTEQTDPLISFSRSLHFWSLGREICRIVRDKQVNLELIRQNIIDQKPDLSGGSSFRLSFQPRLCADTRSYSARI